MAGSLRKQKRGAGKPPAQPAATGAENKSDAPKFFELPAVEEEGVLALDIDVSDISPNPFNDRDTGDVTQLAGSIDEDGLLQDISVMHTAEFAKHYPDAAAHITTKYTLGFGERRWRAHVELGRKTISSIVRDDVAPKIRRVLFVENYHRKNLSPVEEARKFQFLHVEEGMSYRQIVAELHLTGANYVARRLELLKLPTELQDIVDTEDGPKVTLARKIVQQIAEPEDRTRAWVLIRDHHMSLKEAVAHIHSGEPDPDLEDDDEDAGAFPAQRTAATDEREQQTHEDEETDEAEAKPDKPVEAKPKKSAAPPAAGKKKAAMVLAADKDTAQRNNASADRDAACQHLVSTNAELSPEQRDALYARTLLAPMQQGPARTRAHKWLRDAGQAEFAINDTDSYFEAVLSSGNAELINRVTFATALAAGEIRARDGRRQWDRIDAEHVRLLIDAGKYHPQTDWERAQLTKSNVPFPGADEASDTESIAPQES